MELVYLLTLLVSLFFLCFIVCNSICYLCTYLQRLRRQRRRAQWAMLPFHSESHLTLSSESSHVSSEEHHTTSEAPTSPRSNCSLTEINLRQLQTEMRAQNFDVIRFATYRTACKLRFIQKKTALHLVDLWNIIEAFREHGLQTLDNNLEVETLRQHQLLTTVYQQLNKRLPTTAQIPADTHVSLLHAWLCHAYDPMGKGVVRVLSMKVALTTMCSGKHMDKLRYAFTQISDTSGAMITSKFQDYLKEVLALPTAVYEGPSFGFNDTAARACFDGKIKVTVNDFLDTMMSDPGPQCLMWMPILQRMPNVENVLHPVQCDACHAESFVGFRYKCQRCYNYHLCQDCFWRGQTSSNHSNDHEVKEYSTYKSPAKQLSHSLKKSFRCVPNRQTNHIPKFPDQPEKTIDLTHIVPPTPPPLHNGFHDPSMSQRSLDVCSMDSHSNTKSNKVQKSASFRSVTSGRSDQDHGDLLLLASSLSASAKGDAHKHVTKYAQALKKNQQLEHKSVQELINLLHCNQLAEHSSVQQLTEKLNEGAKVEHVDIQNFLYCLGESEKYEHKTIASLTENLQRSEKLEHNAIAGLSSDLGVSHKSEHNEINLMVEQMKRDQKVDHENIVSLRQQLSASQGIEHEHISELSNSLKQSSQSLTADIMKLMHCPDDGEQGRGFDENGVVESEEIAQFAAKLSSTFSSKKVRKETTRAMVEIHRVEEKPARFAGEEEVFQSPDGTHQKGSENTDYELDKRTSDSMDFVRITRLPLTSLTSDDSSLYPDVFTSTPASPTSPSAFEDFPASFALSPSVDSPEPRPTMSTFKPSSASTVSSFKPESINTPATVNSSKAMNSMSFATKVGKSPSFEEVFPKELSESNRYKNR